MTQPALLTLLPAHLSRELDVRPIIAAGGEPCGAILEAISNVPPQGALKLIAPFKPAPLFQMLGSKGWSHWIEAGAGDYWAIWFYRQENAQESVPVYKPRPGEEALAILQKTQAELRTRLGAEDNRWVLDVRGLPPPEPLELTLSVLEKLPPGFELIQINERIPQMLLPLLEERGFRHELVHQGDEVRVAITSSG